MNTPDIKSKENPDLGIKLATIAYDDLKVKSLETSMFDEDDYYNASPEDIKRALVNAYEQGRADSPVKARDSVVEKIAQENLKVDTADSSKQEIAVWDIKRALKRAYEEGGKSSE